MPLRWRLKGISAGSHPASSERQGDTQLRGLAVVSGCQPERRELPQLGEGLYRLCGVLPKQFPRPAKFGREHGMLGCVPLLEPVGGPFMGAAPLRQGPVDVFPEYEPASLFLAVEVRP